MLVNYLMFHIHPDYEQTRTRLNNNTKAKVCDEMQSILSFIKSLELNPCKNCQKHKIKKECSYSFKFPLSQFVAFTGIRFSNHSEQKKLILYFYQLQKLDPIIKIFLKRAFHSYVCFPYVKCGNPGGNSWFIKVLAVKEFFCFPYQFQLPKSFLVSTHKNDLRLKVNFMQSLSH